MWVGKNGSTLGLTGVQRSSSRGDPPQESRPSVVSESAKDIMCFFAPLMFTKLRRLCCLLLGVARFTASARAQTTEVPPSAPHRVRVSEMAGSSLITEKSSLNYPDAARNAGIQGKVVLKVVVGETGEVKDVTIVSGDPVLAQAAAEAVQQWKYKPYMLDGAPIEMETQVSINFDLKPPESTAPPLGTFKDDAYSNESLVLSTRSRKIGFAKPKRCKKESLLRGSRAPTSSLPLCTSHGKRRHSKPIRRLCFRQSLAQVEIASNI